MFAHRGGARLAPENTLAAFVRGIDAGADGVECDVHLSADGVPVVIHDATLDRTTDARGPVNARTAADLARVDAGYHFDADAGFPWRGRAVGVPSLAQVLDALPDARVIIEMKLGGAALAAAVAHVIRRADAVSRVCVGSFHVEAVTALRAADPAIPTSASQAEVKWTLYRSWVRWPGGPARGYCAFQVPEHAGRVRVVSPGFVRQVHREGCVVQVWVVDERERAVQLLSWGVDGLISDRPDLIVQARNEFVAHGERPSFGGA